MGDWDDTTTVSKSLLLVDKPQRVLKASLQQVEGAESPRVINLTEPLYVIGRSKHADLPFECELLSRKHCELRCGESGFSFTDMNSKNGVYLNGIKCHSSLLHDGDMLQIGTVALIFKKTSEIGKD
ncbi:MAG: FHA domain-containing protein [Myxococcota bacterium]|nr:FHA domain-containing protein [Myxococcota bacterium]